MAEAIPFHERISATIDESCRATGLKRTRLYEWVKAKKVKTYKTGRQRLIDIASLKAALEEEAA